MRCETAALDLDDADTASAFDTVTAVLAESAPAAAGGRTGLPPEALLCALMLGGSAVAAQYLPPEALAALQRAKVPADAMSVVVHDASTGQRVLQWQETRPVNPASVTKLLTTMANAAGIITAPDNP